MHSGLHNEDVECIPVTAGSPLSMSYTSTSLLEGHTVWSETSGHGIPEQLRTPRTSGCLKPDVKMLNVKENNLISIWGLR